jgi:hypothetical protein
MQVRRRYKGPMNMTSLDTRESGLGRITPRIGWWAITWVASFYGFVAFALLHQPLLSVTPEDMVRPLIEMIGVNLDADDHTLEMLERFKGGRWTDAPYHGWPNGKLDRDDVDPLDWGALLRYL